MLIPLLIGAGLVAVLIASKSQAMNSSMYQTIPSEWELQSSGMPASVVPGQKGVLLFRMKNSTTPTRAFLFGTVVKVLGPPGDFQEVEFFAESNSGPVGPRLPPFGKTYKVYATYVWSPTSLGFPS